MSQYDNLPQVLVSQPNLDLVNPPQGVITISPLPEGTLLAIYPPLADNTYQFYRFYQVKKGQVPSTQSNMKLVIIDTLGSGILQQASGFDIRVFDSAGLPLDYEVQEVTTGTGDIIVWVNVTTVKDGEFIQLTFGKVSATDGSNPSVVWNDRLAVYHMNNLTDSTGNNDLTNFDTTPTAGKIGTARNFDGIDSFMSSNATLPGDVGWISVWVLPRNITDNDYIVNVRGNKYAIIIGFQDNNFNFFMYPTGAATDTQFTATVDVFQKIDIVTFGSTTKIYKNGALIHDVTDIQNRSGSIQFSIGSPSGTLTFIDAIIDEVQFTDTIPANIDDVIATIYNNQNDNNVFWFKTPLLENGEDNFLVDDQGRNIVAVQT